jgi:hypothetical protein
MIKVTTKQWMTVSGGYYELEQYYTAYAYESFSTCNVTFTTMNYSADSAVRYGCGIRKIMNEYKSDHHNGAIISYGKNIEIRSPNEQIGSEGIVVDFEAIALIVPEQYEPTYHPTESLGGNHTFIIDVNESKTFEYMILGAWSQGAVLTDEESFRTYVSETQNRYNYPVRVDIGKTIESP